jgi:hypothetical protein
VRWSALTVALLFGVTGFIWWWKIATIVSYESARERATIDLRGTVVESHADPDADDTVRVAYRTPSGADRTVMFTVDTAIKYPVGAEFRLRMAAGSAQVFPTTDDVRTPTDTAVTWLLGMAVLGALPVAWCYRLASWRRASRATEEPVTVKLCHGVARVRWTYVCFATAWARIEDSAGRHWYQRLMWEPWLDGSRSSLLSASGRRATPRGPMLITTDRGVLLWAGRASVKEPGSEAVRSGPPRGGSRVSVLLLAGIPALLGGALLGWPGAVVGFAYYLGLVVLYGAPAATLRRSDPER